MGTKQHNNPTIEPTSKMNPIPTTNKVGQQCPTFSITRNGSLHVLYSKFKRGTNPDKGAQFIQLLEKIREHLRTTLDNEGKSRYGTQITNMEGVIDLIINGWMTPMQETTSYETTTFASQLKELRAMAKNTMQIEHIRTQLEHENRCEYAINKINRVAKGLIDVTLAIRQYTTIELEDNTQVCQNIDTTSIGPITIDTSINTPSKTMRKLELVQDHISNIEQVHARIVQHMQEILLPNYPSTMNTRQERTTSIPINKGPKNQAKSNMEPNSITNEEPKSNLRDLSHVQHESIHEAKDNTCRGEGCKREITKYWINRLGGIKERTLCPTCFSTLRHQ